MRTFVMVFKNEDKLRKMLELRRQGWTYQSLALIYGVDHSSIYNWCKIKHIPRPKEPISLDLSQLLSQIGFEVKRDKTYADYLFDEKRRKYPKLYEALKTYN